MDYTTEPDGRVRISLDEEGPNSREPISIPGLLTKIAKTYPDQIAMVSRPDDNGKRTTFTYKLVFIETHRLIIQFIKLLSNRQRIRKPSKDGG